ncbi:hypothetical protein [Neosynechococcus sphagnicola]
MSGGRTNRAQVAFERELLTVLEQLSQQPVDATPESLSESCARS